MSAAPIEDRHVDAITSLLEQLQDEGWSIGTAQILATHNLLVALQGAPDPPPSLDSLARWIGPIVCKSRQQQREFPHRLAAALAAADQARQQKQRRSEREVRLSVAAILLALLGAAVVVLAVWSLWFFLQPSTVPAPPPAIEPMPDPSPQPWSWTPMVFIAAGAAGGLMLIALAIWLWIRRNAEAQLRKVTATDAEVEQVFANVGAVPLQSLNFRRVAQLMRRRRYEATEDLDVTATVEAMAMYGGWFTPRFRQRAKTPEYAVMIDRSTTQDVQAKVFEYAAGQLAHYGVPVDVFFFDRDPRVCWRGARARERFRFESIASAYSDHHLMMFSDGEGLVDRRTGKPSPWLEVFFGSFHDVALLTPRPAFQWDQHEHFLVRAGALVLPASSAGIAAYVSRDDGGRMPAVAYGQSMMPLLLEDDEAQWLSSAEPPREIVDRLMTDLPLAIGDDAMRWLAATAVYPGVEWAVLLLLGQVLKVRDFEENLLAIARLPWFRQGHMPDWIRLRLLAVLDPATEREVRAALFERFDQAVLAKSGVRIARYRDLANATPESSRLADHILADFMSGRKSVPLHLSIPRRFLYRLRQQRSERPRMIERWKAALLAYVPFGSLFLLRDHDPEIRWHAWNGLALSILLLIGLVLCFFPGLLLLPVIAVSAYRAMIGRRLEITYLSRAVTKWSGNEVPVESEADAVAAPQMGTFMRMIGVLFRPTRTFEEIARAPDVVKPVIVFLGAGIITALLTAEQRPTDSPVSLLVEALTLPIGSVAFAALALLFVRVLRGRGTFKQAWSVTLYAWVPAFLSAPLSFFPLFACLVSSIFSLWIMFLLIRGFHVLSGLAVWKLVLAVLSFWAIAIAAVFLAEL